MVKSGVAAHGENRLLRAELAEVAKAGGQPHPGAHGMQRLGLVVPGGKDVKGVAADVTGQETVPAVFPHRLFHYPEAGPVRATGTPGHAAVNEQPGGGLTDPLFIICLPGGGLHFEQGGQGLPHQVGRQLPHLGQVAGVLAVDF